MTDTAAASDPRIVDARPEKQFFISMLVKDIELIPAIVDLVDNSVDGARAISEGDDYDGLKVELTVATDRFRIVDNCGGLEADVARKYAFRFGRPEEFTGVEGSVGQFGVGMKRALFKLGGHFHITSAAANSTFEMDVSVSDWASDTASDWSFRFSSVNDETGAPEGDRGVTIDVTELHDTVRADFGDVDFVGKLRTHLRLRHQDAMSKGLKILINDEIVQVREHYLAFSTDINPIRRSFVVEANGAGGVDVAIIAGIAPGSDADDGRDDADAEVFTEPADAGWYLYCNGRLLLAADKSPLTGWGSAAADYHPQYRRFRGYVYLWAEKAALLPWNTTKTSVDQDSPVFRAVQQEMFKALAGVLTILNRIKKERQERPEGDRPIAAALESATPTLVRDVPASDTFKAPPLPPKPPVVSRVQRIQYDIDRADFDTVKAHLGAPTISEVGRSTFYYYFENEIGS